MCLIAVRWRLGRTHLLLASNRDEFHARPTDPAGWWQPAGAARPVFGGRDRQSGGGWLACTAGGRMAAVTNVRRMVPPDPRAPSRGALVAGFCTTDDPAETFAAKLAAEAMRYAGFNLLLCDGESLWYLSNQDGFQARPLDPGLYALSNASLDTPWPKSERLRAAMASALPPYETLFDALADDRPAPDEALPDTGVGLEMERMLSPPFIRGLRYGTRASTLVAIRQDGRIEFEERRFGAGGSAAGTTRQVLEVA
jgi:uncharacterized protein with NRDE domain